MESKHRGIFHLITVRLLRYTLWFHSLLTALVGINLPPKHFYKSCQFVLAALHQYLPR